MPFGDNPDYRQSQRYIDLNCRFITTLTSTIQNLEKLEEVAPILNKLGADLA
jgi:hypothetical protein